ncbi:hypothetical protein M8J76_010113 [Diaphorina citri]|nr:hypothetical protein M8J75_008630 [Diaphorina citri]KAI5709101.1 hypothetical protein M8J76_010113 [Diaphorina citri]
MTVNFFCLFSAALSGKNKQVVFHLFGRSPSSLSPSSTLKQQKNRILTIFPVATSWRFSYSQYSDIP